MPNKEVNFAKMLLKYKIKGPYFVVGREIFRGS
jgi:hypothetical protein